MKQENKNKKLLWTLLVILASVVLVISVGFMGKDLLQSYQATKEYTDLAKDVRTTTEFDAAAEKSSASEAEPAYVSPIDFKKLASINPDIIGWITIPDTKIDYPIVQTTDNDKYLHTDFEGKESIYGAVYLDMDSKADFSGWNNIFYGHNMKNGTMFKDIVKFKDDDFFNKNREIYIYTPTRTIYLRTVACFYDSADGNARRTKFKNRKALAAFAESQFAKCSFAQPPNDTFNSLFTFVTCSYEFDDARTLLYATEVSDTE